MHALINIALPFFALIFTGYAARSARLLSRSAIAGLNAFVFYFAMPALLLVSPAQAPVREVLDWRLVAAWLLPGLALFWVTYVVAGRAFRRDRSERSIQALAAVFSNVGFIGLPLVVFALGPDAVLPAVMVVLIDNIIMVGLATAVIETHQGRGRGRSRLLGAMLGGVMRNPIIVAGLLGLGLAFLDFSLPQPVSAYLQLLAAAAAPAALLALGATLAGRPAGQGGGETGALVLVKVLVHPMLVWLTACCLGLSGLAVTVLLVQASLPVAASVYVLAQRYRVYAAEASAIVFISTLASVATVSGVLSYLVG